MPQQIKLRQHMLREGTRQKGMMASDETQIEAIGLKSVRLHPTIWKPSQHTCRAQKGATFGKQHTTTRSTERPSLSEETKMSNSDVGRCRAASARTSLRPRRRRRRTVGRNHPSTQRSSGCRDNLQRPSGVATPGFSGPFPFRALGSLGPLPCVKCPRWFESTSWSGLAVRPLSLWDASPGVMSQPPWSLGRF